MYRVSPFTYLIGGMLSAAVGGASVTCADNEYIRMFPPAGQTCGQYLEEMISQRGGYLLDSNTTGECGYCQMQSTNSFLASVSINPDDAWRNFGLMWVYIVFNFAMALFLYWLGRVPKPWNNKIGETPIMTPLTTDEKSVDSANDGLAGTTRSPSPQG